jgi:hypothetical protein
MELIEAKDKFIRVIQKDGFAKYGKLIDITPTQITLEFLNGFKTNISIDFIGSWEIREDKK